jgi:ABC-type transport system involved in multi-copper enzyme maturation permease subunit
MNGMLLLLKRDVRNAMGRRMFLLLAFMVLFQTWFIAGSGSVKKVLETGSMDYMAIVFSFNFFGSLTALALTFDSISRERRNKVLDMLLTSGLKKRTVILSKIWMNLAVSLAFSVLYTVLIALVYVLMSGNARVILMCMRYIPALTAFNFVYCMLGLALSVLLRSSRVSFIVSMAVGLLCMPRLLLAVLEGLADALSLGSRFVEIGGLASPALIMNALAGSADGQTVLAAIAFLAFYVVFLVTLSIAAFQKQNELNYDE